ncbi:MAG TPA: family 20 glycosylhydrolase [Acidimicrobiia bacterium]|nr:family 20 glycosylhydrolase [Acidimicrobiia bacterium]
MNLLPVPRHVELTGTTVASSPTDPEVSRDATLPADGYELSFGSDGRVTIAAADAAGEFYARATLGQLDALGDRPVGTIRDWPDLAVRGVMVDCSRDKVPTLSTLFDLIDRLASWKINHVELYLEHTFAYRNHEVVWRDASPFTATDIRELDEFCRARHVELTPNQNCLGHMRRWLSHDRYRPLALGPPPGEAPRPVPTTIDPANPASLALVRELLAELLASFSSRRVHVGLDEPWELGGERFDDYLGWLHALRDLPELEGREMLVWGDILAENADRIAQLPDGVTTCEWGYEGTHPFAARTAAYAEADKPFWVAPGTSAWCTLVGRVTNMRANVAGAADAAAEHGGVGLLTTDWGDLGHLQYLPVSDPGLAYAAAMAWCRDTNRELDLAAALSAHCYDDPTGRLADALLALGDVHRAITPQAPNISALIAPLYWPQLHLGRGFLGGFDIAELDRVDEIVDHAVTDVAAATPRRPDGDLLADELANGAALVSLVARDERARLEGDGTLPSVPQPVRDALAEELRPLIDRHRELWLARNRRGGLDDSAAWLEHLAACYATGETPNDWGAWT